jgi:endonuclease/exonuclease/phosphatase family metal-dependent hydrolase
MGKKKFQKMKVIQLNIWGGKLDHSIISFLNHEQADIVCLQEVNELEGKTGGMFAPLSSIKERTGYEYAFMAPAHTYHYMNRKCLYGNAILSKLPISDGQIAFVHGAYQENYDTGEHDNNNRNIQSPVTTSL